MPLFAEEEGKIFGDIMNDVVNNTNLSRSSIGSKTRSIAEAVSKKMGRMWATFDLNYLQAYVDGASGRYLDFIGSMMGLQRLGETSAVVSSEDKVVRLFVEVGTFGDINSGSSITINEGTIISTASNGGGTLYKVPFTVILAFDQDEFFLSLESIASGSGINVGANELRFHDFINYTDVVNKTLKVTNDAEIAMARDIESDANFRFRIVNAILSAESANQTAIRIAVLSVPGVADAIILPFNRGIGTFDVILRAITPTVADSLVTSVQETIAAVSAMGINPFVRKPVETGISMVGTITLKRAVSAAEEESIIQTATENVISYINNLDISEPFIVNQVLQRVIGTSDTIKNMGTTGKPLDSLYVYRPSELEDSKIRGTLLGDYTPESDEKVIVENRNAGTTPILFRIR